MSVYKIYSRDPITGHLDRVVEAECENYEAAVQRADEQPGKRADRFIRETRSDAPTQMVDVPGQGRT